MNSRNRDEGHGINHKRQQQMTTKLEAIKNSIKQRLSVGDLDIVKKSTCDLAPLYGWSEDEFMLMDAVTDELAKEGYSVRYEFRHGVKDYYIMKSV